VSAGDVRVGLAQWAPGPDPAVNLRTAVAAIKELARRGCGLVVLPELWLCGYRPATLGEDARAAAEPLDGPVQRRLAGLAREAGIVLCAGSFPERAGNSGMLFNTAVVYGPGGELLLAHRKTCLYGDAETGAFAAGAVAVTVGEVPGLGLTGLCVCFDGDFTETGRALRAAGAGVVLHPCAYEAAAESWWDTIYPAQALCNGQWWISSNLHGGSGADLMLGGSRVIAPDGRVVAAAPRHAGAVPESELLVADIAVGRELATAAAASGVLWSPPPRRTEDTQ
jgi:predicted amidohydrolase